MKEVPVEMKETPVIVKGPFVVQFIREGVRFYQFFVGLKEKDSQRVCVVFIDQLMASAIYLALTKQHAERPLTHDLMVSVIDRFNIVVKGLVITKVENDTFHALLRLESGGNMIEIDSRPSDGLVLASKKGSPVFVNDDLLEVNQYFNDFLEKYGQEGAQLQAPSSSSPSDPEQSDWFKNLNPNDLKKM